MNNNNTRAMKNEKQENQTMDDLYETHKNSILWYISERFNPQEAVEKVLDGSPLEDEYAYNLRHLFGA